MTRRGSIDILLLVVRPRTQTEELSHDPRGEGTRPAFVRHASRRGAPQRDRGLSPARDLAHLVLSLARSVLALRRRRSQAASATPSATAAAGSGSRRGSGVGLCAAVADPRP